MVTPLPTRFTTTVYLHRCDETGGVFLTVAEIKEKEREERREKRDSQTLTTYFGPPHGLLAYAAPRLSPGSAAHGPDLCAPLRVLHGQHDTALALPRTFEQRCQRTFEQRHPHH